MQVNDELGPWKSTLECFLRGADIIRDIASKTRIMSAHAMCVELEKKTPEHLTRAGKPAILRFLPM